MQCIMYLNTFGNYLWKIVVDDLNPKFEGVNMNFCQIPLEAVIRWQTYTIFTLSDDHRHNMS